MDSLPRSSHSLLTSPAPHHPPLRDRPFSEIPDRVCRIAEELRKGSHSDFFHLFQHLQRPVKGVLGKPRCILPSDLPKVAHSLVGNSNMG